APKSRARSKTGGTGGSSARKGKAAPKRPARKAASGARGGKPARRALHPEADAVRVTLYAVGQRMPGWVTEGFTEYTRRLKPRLAVGLVEIPAARRAGSDTDRARAEE